MTTFRVSNGAILSRPFQNTYFMQEAYIVAGFRTAVTKSKKGGFRFMRSDELAIEVIKG